MISDLEPKDDKRTKVVFNKTANHMMRNSMPSPKSTAEASNNNRAISSGGDGAAQSQASSGKLNPIQRRRQRTMTSQSPALKVNQGNSDQLAKTHQTLDCGSSQGSMPQIP